MSNLLSHLTYARVVSTLALFLALGGGAYALALGKNDVTSRHIKNNTVKSADVRKDSLKGKDVRERKLDTSEFTAAASTPFAPDQPIRCDPEAVFIPCGEVSLNTPVRGRVLVIASGELIAIPDEATGSCRIHLDGTQIGEVPDRSRADHGFSVSGVSGPVEAGSHTAGVVCLEAAGEIAVEIYGVTAVLVGGG